VSGTVVVVLGVVVVLVVVESTGAALLGGALTAVDAGTLVVSDGRVVGVGADGGVVAIGRGSSSPARDQAIAVMPPITRIAAAATAIHR
jgi:hypothetical protein